MLLVVTMASRESVELTELASDYVPQSSRDVTHRLPAAPLRWSGRFGKALACTAGRLEPGPARESTPAKPDV